MLSLFVIFEVNYAQLTPLSQLAIFAMLGMVLCLLIYPIAPRLKDNQILRAVDLLLAVAVVVICRSPVPGFAVQNGRVPVNVAR